MKQDRDVESDVGVAGRRVVLSTGSSRKAAVIRWPLNWGLRKSGQLTSWRQGSKHGHPQGSILCVFEEKQREEMAVMWWIQERVVENEVTEELREKSCRILKAQWRTLGFKASEMGSCWKVCSEHWLYLICVLKRLQRDELYGNGRHRETSLKPSAKVWEREIKITWLG